MSIIPVNTSKELVSDTAIQTIKIQSIEVKYNGKRERCTWIKIKAEGDKVHKSPHYKESEEIKWVFDKQFPSPSQFEIVVQEHNRFSPNDDYSFQVTVGDSLAINPIIVKNEPHGKFSVNIYCEATGPFINIVRRLIEESKDKLEDMKVFLESFGKACEVLNLIANVTGLVSDVNPAVATAASAILALYEMCKKRQECHKAAITLMDKISSFLPFVEVPKDRLKSRVTIETTEKLLVLFKKITDMIQQYSSETVLGFLLTDHTDEVDTLKEAFKRQKETFDWCVKTEMWKTVLEIELYTGDTTLTRLRAVPQAFYDMEKACFEGSRRDTVQAIEDWSRSESKLFWLYGPEKSGKSAIAHTVAHLFDAQNRLAGCFFCNANDQDCRSARRVMPTIAYQLAKWHRDYRTIILGVLQDRREQHLESGLERQFDLLVKQPITQSSVHQLPLHSSLVIVLDAVDECCDCAGSEDDLANLISKIARVAPWLKVFVSSRKLPESHACFLQGGDITFDISNTDLDLRNDLVTYTQYVADHQSGLVKGSHGTKKQASGLLSRIHSVLQGSDKGAEGKTTLFQTVVNCIRRTLSDNRELITKHLNVLVISSYIASKQPKTESLILYFLEPFHPGTTPDVLHNIIKSLYPFVDLGTDGNIRTNLPVQIFVDTMSEKAQMGHVWVDPRLLKVQIAGQCLSTLHSQLKFNVCDFGLLHLRNEDNTNLGNKADENISEVLRYSSLHWMDHVLQVEDGREFQGPVTELLCSTKALFWIEVLGLLGLLEKGKEILLQCAGHFKEVDEIARAATELHRFISTFYDTITISTSHLYVSALTWFHSDSSVMQCASDAFDGWRSPLSDKPPQHVALSNTSEKEADISLLKGNTGGISKAKYTPDESKIVSTTNYGVLQIWDAKSGEAIREPFWYHVPRILAIAYSPDGSRIASGSDNGKLRIWDAHTGALLIESQEGHSERIEVIAYSPDGTRIVTGSHDYTLRIWDVQSGACVGEPLTGHIGSVYAVAFAPDGRRIVSGSRDETLRIWDAQSGAQVGKPLTGHERRIWAVAYAPDGSRIVSCASDCTLRIWDAQSGTSIGAPLKGHSGEVTSVAYSPDGTRVVSGSDDRTLRIWDARSGKPVGEPLRGHRTWVKGIAYSPDGHRIVSGSGDETLRIWDAHSGESIGEPLSGHESEVVSVAYSPDGNEIASGSYDGTIRLWDAHNGACIKTMFLSESRWDPDAQSFLTVTSNFLGLSITHTVNPLTIPRDGWLRTLDGSLFLWIPPEHRRSVCDGKVRIPNNENGRVMYIDWTKVPHGKDWTKIMHC